MWWTTSPLLELNPNAFSEWAIYRLYIFTALALYIDTYIDPYILM